MFINNNSQHTIRLPYDARSLEWPLCVLIVLLLCFLSAARPCLCVFFFTTTRLCACCVRLLPCLEIAQIVTQSIGLGHTNWMFDWRTWGAVVQSPACERLLQPIR